MIEMPQYQCHKKVRALEIDRLEVESDGSVTMHFLDPGYEPKRAAEPLFVRYQPVHGDFYVLYENGYESISPRAPFLDGYSRLG